MQHVRILMGIALASALTGCGGLSGGGVRLDPLPANIAAPCPHPSTFLRPGARTVADDEIMVGRIGDALIDCEGRRSAAVAAYEAAAKALGGK